MNNDCGELNQARWLFPGDKDGETKGLNDAGIETFNGSIITSLAREICQNSIDAKVDEEDAVEVEFSLFKITKENFPDCAGFKKVLSQAISFWNKQGDKKTISFLNTALLELEKDEIICLRVSDTNTSGLNGVANLNVDEPTPWKSLVKSSGTSSKGERGIGSFGIGKFACFSCSRFRTVFYATKTLDNQEGFQGVVRIVSFRDDEHNLTQGVGFCGNENYKPILSWNSLDTSYIRKSPGTDIFIIGFLGEPENWKDEIKKSVLDGFLFAVFNRKLIVKISDDNDNSLIIDRNYLELEYQKNTLDKDVNDKYKVLTSSESKESILDFHERGKIILYLLQGRDLNRKISMIRQPGMKIFDKDRYPAHISFTGMLIVEGVKLNEVLKKFENPQHTKWEPNRNPEEKKLLEEIYGFCREQINNLVEVNDDDSIDSGLGDILPSLGNTEEQYETEVLSTKIKTNQEEKIKKKKPKKTKNIKDESETKVIEIEEILGEGDDGAGKNDEKTQPGHDSKSGGETHNHDNEKKDSDNRYVDVGNGNDIPDNEGEKIPTTKFILLEPKKLRIFCLDKLNGLYKLIIETSRTYSFCELKIIAMAENESYVAPLVDAKILETGQQLQVDTEMGIIRGLSLSTGQIVEIVMEMDYSDYLSLEVECYAHN